MNVGLIFGGRSVEHRVSVASARTVAGALAGAGHQVVPLGIAPDGCWVDAATAERALGDRGRVLLRPSGTEPLIRVMVEGADEAQVTAIAERLADVVRDQIA